MSIPILRWYEALGAGRCHSCGTWHSMRDGKPADHVPASLIICQDCETAAVCHRCWKYCPQCDTRFCPHKHSWVCGRCRTEFHQRCQRTFSWASPLGGLERVCARCVQEQQNLEHQKPKTPEPGKRTRPPNAPKGHGMPWAGPRYWWGGTPDHSRTGRRKR